MGSLPAPTHQFSFSRWRFSRQAELRWNKLRAQANKPTKYEPDRSSFQVPTPQKVVNVSNVKPGPQNMPAPIAEVLSFLFMLSVVVHSATAFGT